MKIKSVAHVKLQIAISEWMREELPEAAPLFNYGGVSTGKRRFNHDTVATGATNAAYEHIIAVLEALGLGE